jgi:hypothetical protein
MKFVRNGIRFLTNLNNVIFFSLLLIVFILVQFVFRLDFISDNNTWIYSSSMQTLAALIALLPISYGYYITNLDSEKNENLDSYIIERLKSDVYYNMMTVIVYNIAVIILNLFSFFVLYSPVITFIIALLTIGGVGLISQYIYLLFDPNRVKAILKEYDTSSEKAPSKQVISLDNFITTYLELESSVKDFISNENDNELVDEMPLYDIVDNYSKDFPELQNNFDIFKEIIFHRNNVIHNYNETAVDPVKYNKLLELIDVFERLNAAFIQKNIFGNVVAVKTLVEKSVSEYMIDLQNKSDLELDDLEDLKEELTSLLHSYFISNYYITRSLDDANEADFEVIQSNYSERKLVAVDIKSLSQKNIGKIADAYFKRLENRFYFVFLVNYISERKVFHIMYQTKDKELRTVIVK